MKITQILLRQHLGRQFKFHWRIQGKRVPIDLGSEAFLTKKGIPVCQVKEFLQEKPKPEVEVVGVKPKPVKFDNTHPNWHERVCYTYRDDNVLLEGLNQAKIITKSVEIKSGLPESFDLKPTTKDVHKKVKEIIYNSHLFDAEQRKLPKVKDPLRPAWNFPRTYGITDHRVTKLMTSKLLQLIESHSSLDLARQRLLVNDLHFSFPFEKYGDLLQFQLRGDSLLTASKPLAPLSYEDTTALQLPNLFPINEKVTLNIENIYELRNLYPIDTVVSKRHPHTVFVHHNKTEVKNLYEEPVTDTQILGRSLLKAFTVAASYAKQQYGESIKSLQKPVVVQSVQTDGRLFHFGVFQLNTLNLEGVDGVKNLWFQTSELPLFESCSYVSGKPTLLGYNGEVIQYLLSFYENS